jgi:PilZ domain
VQHLPGDKQRSKSTVQLGTSVRLLLDTPDGLLTTYGQLVDLSEVGFSVYMRRSIEAHHVGRVNFTVRGEPLWLPMVTRWIREDAGGSTVGCEFDRPTPEKQQAIRDLLREGSAKSWEPHAAR